jgi:hypothetical protein
MAWGERLKEGAQAQNQPGGERFGIERWLLYFLLRSRCQL